MTSSWHFGILRSRAFSRLRGQNLVLIPLADLINHNPAITTEDSAYKIKGGGLSRAFSRLRGQNLVLIPLADLINHNPAITTEDSAYKIKGGGLFSRDLFFPLEIPRFC
ncbi:hypothetical protein F2Q68_00013344 [Brassica cretica]|uniref:SET domain-containing protein n=1 Tax=Brassica cretica TaxID=69181 RepID=A0A8S9H8F0_BRACR|nr:hypothetical protein F2Q68_00013344 [Brassica cretica]